MLELFGGDSKESLSSDIDSLFTIGAIFASLVVLVSCLSAEKLKKT